MTNKLGIFSTKQSQNELNFKGRDVNFDSISCMQI